MPSTRFERRSRRWRGENESNRSFLFSIVSLDPASESGRDITTNGSPAPLIASRPQTDDRVHKETVGHQFGTSGTIRDPRAQLRKAENPCAYRGFRS